MHSVIAILIVSCRSQVVAAAAADAADGSAEQLSNLVKYGAAHMLDLDAVATTATSAGNGLPDDDALAELLGETTDDGMWIDPTTTAAEAHVADADAVPAAHANVAETDDGAGAVAGAGTVDGGSVGAGAVGPGSVATTADGDGDGNGNHGTDVTTGGFTVALQPRTPPSAGGGAATAADAAGLAIAGSAASMHSARLVSHDHVSPRHECHRSAGSAFEF
jgi:hypothetical protein